LALSKCPEPEDEVNRLGVILEKIRADTSIPPFLRKYYEENLEAFSQVYYDVVKNWADRALDSSRYFTLVNYRENDELFEKIQQFAKRGKIVATIGSINDLSFLHNFPVSFVDVSNVHDYAILDLQGCDFSRPIRVMWTKGTSPTAATRYTSFQYEKLTAPEKKEMDYLQSCLKEATGLDPKRLRMGWAWTLSNVVSRERLERPSQCPIACYTKEALGLIREFCRRNLYNVPDYGFVLFEGIDQVERLNGVPQENIDLMIKDPNLHRHVQALVRSYSLNIRMQLYVQFIDLPGWKECFEEDLQSGKVRVCDVVERLKKDGVWDTFIARFGKERIARWKPEHRDLISSV
jgi:hypothetical protein